MNNSKPFRREPKYIPTKESVPVFSTYDLGCSAALLSAGFELLSVNKSNPYKSLFVFRQEDDIEDAVEQYFADRLEVKARRYFDNLKALKNSLHRD
jgi:hypothetical protein